MIGERIKSLRESKGYNMRQMAAALNLPYTTYVNYEKGAREPNSEQLILISKYFGVSIDYLMGRTDIPVPSDNNEYKNLENFGNNSVEEEPEELVILNRAAKKMTPENRQKLLDMARIMFKEDFDD